MNWIVADMRRAVEVIRVFLRDSHAFESERGVEAVPEKFRVYAGESATRNVEGMSYFQCRRLFPHRVAGNLVVNLSDENPICCAVKRGAHPLLIDLCARACGHSGI